VRLAAGLLFTGPDHRFPAAGRQRLLVGLPRFSIGNPGSAVSGW